MVEIFNIQMYHFSRVGVRVWFFLSLNHEGNKNELVVLNDICCVDKK